MSLKERGDLSQRDLDLLDLDGLYEHVPVVRVRVP